MYKVTISDGTTYRGFRLFATEEDADKYVKEIEAHLCLRIVKVLPTPKILFTPSLQKAFPNRYKLVRECLCAECGKKVNPDCFRTNKDIDEYGLSAMCQSCQDEFFGPE